MKLDCDYKDFFYLKILIKEYRIKFLKRKNINEYQRQKKGSTFISTNRVGAWIFHQQIFSI